MTNFVSMSSYKKSNYCRLEDVVHCQISVNCQCCNTPLGEECLLSDKISGKNLFDSRSGNNYFRIIFGVHPGKLTGSFMPAIFTPVYICNDCVAMYETIGSLLRIVYEMRLPDHWLKGDVSALRPNDGGFWITVWGNQNGTNEPPLWNGQFDQATFLAIIDKIAKIPNNPFRIYKRKT